MESGELSVLREVADLRCIKTSGLVGSPKGRSWTCISKHYITSSLSNVVRNPLKKLSTENVALNINLIIQRPYTHLLLLLLGQSDTVHRPHAVATRLANKLRLKFLFRSQVGDRESYMAIYARNISAIGVWTCMFLVSWLICRLVRRRSGCR